MVVVHIGENLCITRKNALLHSCPEHISAFQKIEQNCYLLYSIPVDDYKRVFVLHSGRITLGWKIHVMNLAPRCVPLRGRPWGGGGYDPGGTEGIFHCWILLRGDTVAQTHIRHKQISKKKKNNKH